MYRRGQRVRIFDGEWDSAGEVVSPDGDGRYLVREDGREGLPARSLDARSLEPEPEAPILLPEGGEVSLGSWVVAEYVNSPSADLVRVEGEVAGIETADGRPRLLLLAGPSGIAERYVWLDEIVSAGPDA